MKSIIAIVIVVVIVGGLITMQKDTDNNNDHRDGEVIASYEIHPSEVAEKIKNNEDFILLDVRTPEEYAEVHLEDALLLPVESMTQETLNQIGLGEDMKDKEIIVYCRSGGRSLVAYNIMESLGYTSVKSSAGGMIHWQEDNYPYTESGPYEGALVGTEIEQTQTDGSKISVDRDLHDFGEIPQFGGTVETTFIVKNEGTEDLVIGELTTSCSCTSASIASKKVAPGDETILTVIFDPDFHEEPLGVFKRTVFIPSSDPNTPEAEIYVSVDILEGE